MHFLRSDFHNRISSAISWRSKIYISVNDGKIYETDENFNKTLFLQLNTYVMEFAPYKNEMAMCTEHDIYIYNADRNTLIKLQTDFPVKNRILSIDLRDDLVASDSKGNLYFYERKNNFKLVSSRALEPKAINKVMYTDSGIVYITKQGYLVNYNEKKDSKKKMKISDSLVTMAISPDNLIAVGDKKGTVYFIQDRNVVGKCVMENREEEYVLCLVYYDDFYCVCRGFIYRVRPDGYKRVYGTIAYVPHGVFLLNKQVYFFSFSEVQRIEGRKDDFIEDLIWSK